jgi:hypothetical protein
VSEAVSSDDASRGNQD